MIGVSFEIPNSYGNYLLEILENVQIKKVEVMISSILHVLFGLILLPYSLGAAILFFVTDRLLQQSNHEFNWLHSVKSLAIPCAVLLSFMGMVYLEHILFN